MALAAPSVHKHPTKDETFVLLRGKVKVTTHNDDGTVIESVVLCPWNSPLVISKMPDVLRENEENKEW